MDNSQTPSVFTKEDAYRNLDRVNHWLANGDQKISFALAFLGVLLGFFFSSDKTTETITGYIKNILYVDTDGFKLIISYVGIAILFALIVVVVLALWRLLIGLKASIDPSVYSQPDLETDSKLFWLTISKGDFSSFKQKTENLTEEELINDINSQTYINSLICTKKFENYNEGRKYVKYAFLLLILFKFVNYFTF